MGFCFRALVFLIWFAIFCLCCMVLALCVGRLAVGVLESVVADSGRACYALVGHAWFVLRACFLFLYSSPLEAQCNCCLAVGVLEIVVRVPLFVVSASLSFVHHFSFCWGLARCAPGSFRSCVGY